MAKRQATTTKTGGGEPQAVTATAVVPAELATAVREATQPAVPVVLSAEAAALAEGEVVRLKALLDELDRRFDAVQQPFNAALKQLRGLRKDLTGAVEARMRAVSGVLLEWRGRERARLAAVAEAAAREEQQRAADRLARAAEAAATPAARESLAQQAEAVAAAPVYAPAPVLEPLAELREVRRWAGEVEDVRALVLAAAASEMETRLAAVPVASDVQREAVAVVQRFLQSMRGPVPVPLDAVAADEVAINRYAREVAGAVRWPGVRWVERVTLSR